MMMAMFMSTNGYERQEGGMYLKPVLLLIFFWVLSACDSDVQHASLPVPEMPQRQYDASQLAIGEKVFQANCAKCHGADAQGAAEWTKRGADGNYPPPPLNGSGHAWHHSNEVLEDVIRNGSPDGKGNMPAWQGKISDQEITAVIAWFQSKWPKEVYDAWYEIQQRGR